MSLLEDAVLTGKVKTALLPDEFIAADRRVNEHLLEVQVENNSVFLTGRQGDVDARNAAVETAAHVPGVVEDIEIMPAT